MDRFDALRLFVRVVETGSFSKAARAIGVGQPAVSKQVAALEEHLGAQLLHRTPRGLTLTAAGQDYYESAVRLIEQFEEAEARIGRRQAAPSGRVRVASSAGMGRLYLMPKLPAFLEKYPEVSVDFDITERHVNLIEDGVDVALRIGFLSDSSLMARRIGDVEAVAVATPDYLARRGEPTAPSELEGHDLVSFVFQGATRPWRFQGPAGPITLEPEGRVRSNDAEHVRAAVLAGIGIGYNASWLYADALTSGAVKPLLAGYPSGFFPIHAVTPGGRRTPSRVRVFIDFLAEVCAADPHLRIRSHSTLE